jgi:hypothetical protein
MDEEGDKQDTRPRGKRPFAVWVTAEERAAIESRAAATGLSASAYLRSVGLGYAPRSTLDAVQVTELLKVAGDLGRLGGLLKMWLVERPGVGAPAGEVTALLHRIGELRERLADRVMEL